MLGFSVPGSECEGMPSLDALLYPPDPDVAGSSDLAYAGETTTGIFGMHQDQSNPGYITLKKLSC